MSRRARESLYGAWCFVGFVLVFPPLCLYLAARYYALGDEGSTKGWTPFYVLSGLPERPVWLQKLIPPQEAR